MKRSILFLLATFALTGCGASDSPGTGHPISTNINIYTAVPNVDSSGLHYCDYPTCTLSPVGSIEGTYGVYGDGNGGPRSGVDTVEGDGTRFTLVVKTANTNQSNPPHCGLSGFPCGGPGAVNDLMWIQGSWGYAN